jgi:acetyl esterase/lipase
MRMLFAAGLAGLLGLAASTATTAEPGIRERLARLAYNVQAGEDLSAIKRLQRSYGYFVDKGLWTDLAEYFTDDAVANYPAGTFIGKASIREHLYRNVGNVPVGQVGLGDNRLYNHMNIQPVVHLDPGGRTAKGRWRALAYFGTYGSGDGTWAEGVYEMQYRKEGGAWKISRLDYYSGFGASYAKGWAPPQAAAPTGANAATTSSASPAAQRAPRQLAHPADQPRNAECDGFPKACIAPFHYANLGNAESARAWSPPGAAPLSKDGEPPMNADNLARRAARLRDEQQIENLQRIYGYYLDRAQWDQLADLFADDGTIEFAQQGVYAGRKRVREFLGTLGPAGLAAGWLNDHLQLQPVVTVAPDGLTAHIRSREFGMTGHVGGDGQWSEGIYENQLVKQGGAWKFRAVHYYPTFITAYDKGWSKDAQPAPGPLAKLPPDQPPTERYEIFPKAHIPAFHYSNAVTGRPVTYPQGQAVTAQPAPPVPKMMAFVPTPQAPAVETRRPGLRYAASDLYAVLDVAERDIARVQDYDEIENLESAYGYFLDKNLWNPLADLFSRNGSIELAQRGVYKGPRLREFLVKVFGRGQEGPVENRLGNHLNLQPVIDIAPDGRTAKVRARMLQQMSMGAHASMGGAIYENEIIKEDGAWKFSKVHAYNTFTAGYEGGWARAASTGMPGPAAEFPPDSPPTAGIAMLPIVYEIPYHYANPVTGRTALAPVPALAAQQAQFPPQPATAPAARPAALAAPAGMPADIAAALRDIGAKIEAPRTTALYAPLHEALKHDGVQVRRDQAYGPHERHRADVFTAKAAAAARPIVVFVHGGGFGRGAKSTPGQFAYDNVGYWAAEHGLVGVAINYRLAPEFQYPAGAEDVGRAVQWLRDHAREFGGDPARIFLWGHSAGGAHVADYLVRTPRPNVAGAILLSPVLAAVPTWKSYYGEDETRYTSMSSLPKLGNVSLPMLVAWAELDPPDFVPDTEKLVAARKAATKPTVSLRLPNHSHLSEAYAVGTADESLTAPILNFIKAPPR